MIFSYRKVIISCRKEWRWELGVLTVVKTHPNLTFTLRRIRKTSLVV